MTQREWGAGNSASFLLAQLFKKYYATPTDQEDLISIGTIGLIKGVDSFDPTQGIRLSSYVSRCIENEILMHFRSGRKSAQDVSLSEPIDTDKEGNALTILDTMAVDDTILETIDRRMKAGQYGLLGCLPQPQREVAQALGISRSYVSRIEKKALEKLRRAFGEE